MHCVDNPPLHFEGFMLLAVSILSKSISKKLLILAENSN